MTRARLAAAALAVLAAACGTQDSSPPADAGAAPAAPATPAAPTTPATPATPAAPGAPASPATEPAEVTVDHILVMVSNARAPQVVRSNEDAKKLAYEILEKVKADPTQWNALKEKHSEDPPGPRLPRGGPYALANKGVTPVPPAMARHVMVKGFGDAAFRLPENGFGMVDYDPATSPYGYHVLRRVR
jgi:hypothetical protein